MVLYRHPPEPWLFYNPTLIAVKKYAKHSAQDESVVTSTYGRGTAKARRKATTWSADEIIKRPTILRYNSNQRLQPANNLSYREQSQQPSDNIVSIHRFSGAPNLVPKKSEVMTDALTKFVVIPEDMCWKVWKKIPGRSNLSSTCSNTVGEIQGGDVTLASTSPESKR